MLAARIRVFAIAALVTVGAAALAFGENTDAAASKKVNINTASSEQLAYLPRIGAKVADRIVERRKEKPFSRPEELDPSRYKPISALIIRGSRVVHPHACDFFPSSLPPSGAGLPSWPNRLRPHKPRPPAHRAFSEATTFFPRSPLFAKSFWTKIGRLTAN